MKIIHNNGNIHFMDVYGRNYVIPEGWEGEETEDTILIISQRIHEGREWQKLVNDAQDDAKSRDEKE